MADINEIRGRIKALLGDERTRMYIVLGGTLVLAGLYLVFLIIPQGFELSKTSRTVKDLNDKIDLVTYRVARLDKMTARLNSLRAELEGYYKGLPKEKEIPEFLEELSAIAKESGVKILSITPSESEGKEAEGMHGGEYYREIPIHITAKSGYHQLGKFISSIEQGRRFIRVGDLRIRHDSRLPRRHTIRIVLKTYVSVENDKK